MGYLYQKSTDSVHGRANWRRWTLGASMAHSYYSGEAPKCREYDEKIGHLALSHIELDLDDGVKVNTKRAGTDKKTVGSDRRKSICNAGILCRTDWSIKKNSLQDFLFLCRKKVLSCRLERNESRIGLLRRSKTWADQAAIAATTRGAAGTHLFWVR